MVEPWQIEEDLAQLKPLTSCIRTYSIDHGLDKIPEIARRHGMKVSAWAVAVEPSRSQSPPDRYDHRARQHVSRRDRGDRRRQ
jgi:hypothetical protein